MHPPPSPWECVGQTCYAALEQTTTILHNTVVLLLLYTVYGTRFQNAAKAKQKRLI